MSCPPSHHQSLIRLPKQKRHLEVQLLISLTILSICFLAFSGRSVTGTGTRRGPDTTEQGHPARRTPGPDGASNQNQRFEYARVSDDVSVGAARRANPVINLSDGQDVVAAYEGPDELRQALQQDQAEPLSLASADFDEDGVPDLVSGYGYQGRGIVSLLRGNVDSIYANAPEAQQRRANGSFTDTPFLSPARLSQVPTAADFIGTGDFDGDGHSDVVTGSRGSDALYLLTGDGRGGFSAPQTIDLGGVPTAFATGEINRADGLTDVIVGVSTKDGPRLLVFEGPNGALKAHPEVLRMPAVVTALALGQLDHSYEMDLAVGVAEQLLIVHGRDRKLSLDAEQQEGVQRPHLERRAVNTLVRSLAIGDFSGQGQIAIALLTDSGQVDIFTAPPPENSKQKELGGLQAFRHGSRSSQAWPQATTLVRTKVSSLPGDDLVVVDAAGQQLQVLNSSVGEVAVAQAQLTTNAAPIAMLAMRLNTDSLTDLVFLKKGQSAPEIIHTQAVQTFVVNTKADTDDGACNAANCTLREAISAANANPGSDNIFFSIGSGQQTINLQSSLPIITDSVTIDATTQSGYAGKPIIELNGTGTGGGEPGLDIMAGNSVVRGLVINRFGVSQSLQGGIGIILSANGGNVIEGNFVGTDINGIADRGNFLGVWIYEGSGNKIGGTSTIARNVISGNDQQGVRIRSADNLVQGNFIGTDVNGTGDLGNTFSGVIILGTNNTIGGTSPGSRNILSGKNADPMEILPNGIDIFDPAKGNLVQGNFIGPDFNGTKALGNGVGIDLSANNNAIGGTTSSARNIISGNLQGVYVYSGTDNIIHGNYIGTDANGTAKLGNTAGGIFVTQAPGTTIGGATAGARNIISSNGPDPTFLNGGFGIGIGVSVQETLVGGSGTLVQGNYIGTDVSGVACLGNAQDGIFVNVESLTHTIKDNLIRCNGRNGINIPDVTDNPGSPAYKITITSNQIFANSLTAIDLGNAGDTPNDDLDTDDGANTLQNYPELETAATSALTNGVKGMDSLTAASITFNYRMRSSRNSTFNVEFFASNGSCVRKQFTSSGERLGTQVVTTDANGIANRTITLPLPTAVSAPQWVLASATATNVPPATIGTSPGNTSEMSQCLSVSAAAWQPVLLTTSQVEIKTWTFEGTTYAYVKLLFPDAGYRVASFGLPVRAGNDFTGDASIERFTGPSVQAVTTTAGIYDLGVLTPGSYNFTFKNSGTVVKTQPFTVAAPPFPANPIDNAREFVKQQYRDFLNREADPAGENFWTDNITRCSDPARRPAGQTEAQCTLRQRETTSGAFFQSPEFQYTGYFVHRMYQGALGRQPKLSEFIPDAQFVGAGIVINGQLSGAKINQNKADFAAQFVNCTDATTSRCAEFKLIYDGLNNQQYVDKLFQTTGINASAADRAALVNELQMNPTTGRATVLQKVVDGINVISEGNEQFTTTYGQAFYNAELNRAFVLFEYFGYLKRDPDEAGYAFWLGKLNQFNGNFVNAEMVLAFISSPEYRARFGQP